MSPGEQKSPVVENHWSKAYGKGLWKRPMEKGKSKVHSFFSHLNPSHLTGQTDGHEAETLFLINTTQPMPSWMRLRTAPVPMWPEGGSRQHFTQEFMKTRAK